MYKKLYIKIIQIIKLIQQDESIDINMIDTWINQD